MPKLGVHNLAMSLDGCAAGPNQSLDEPLGDHGRDFDAAEVVTSPESQVTHVRLVRR